MFVCLFVFSYQRTPLHIAVREGQEYTVKSLVENGASVNSKDKDGVSDICELEPDRTVLAERVRQRKVG